MTIRILRNAVALALALASAQAAALGLGQIEVRSTLNEPLLAEIPVIYTDPAELEQLQARLASPETFARVGLEPPQGTVADLQFAIALDARGRTVVRVTSSQPVNTSLLIFLVEVDSGQSRVVREYSALIDVPRAAPIAVGPVIDAPDVALANTVARPLQDIPAASAPVATQPAQPDAPASPGAIPVAPVPAAPVPVAAAPAPAPAVTASNPPQREYGPVKPGQTLSQIAGQLDAATGYSLDQTMIALLRTNPEAFIGEDINMIRSGAILRVPQPNEISGVSAAEASVLVQGQIDQWRQARRPAPQPAVVASVTAPTTPVAAQAPAPPARRVADARLEIVPSAASRGKQAGTRSGASAGGEGEMLRQELQQSKEDLAARDAEVVELQTRIAELEKLQQQQGQLITLKDTELAAAQQRLAESNRSSAPSAAVATTTQPGQPAPATGPRDTAWLWPLGIVILAVAGLLGWWFSRRRRVADAPVKRGFSTESLAASMPSSLPAGSVTEPPHPDHAATSSAPPPQQPPSGRAPGPVAAVPAWNTAGPSAPTWHAGATPRTSSEPAAAGGLAIGHERLELARAYIDLGDNDTARGLLQEVVDVGDAAERTAAARLLREMS